jgi:acyl-CoA synthetase (AMP-forming)/AMP-acid ligase II
MTICAAYVPAIGADASTWNLRERLAEVLPPYMVPSRWMAFDALPLNTNGKIDRPRLREQFSAAMSAPDRTEALREHAVFLS